MMAIQNQCILQVEDNPDDAELTRRALVKANLANALVTVGDGVAALDYLFGEGEYADHPHPLPSLVLLDINLPKLDGHEVLKRIRADPRTRLLPVVMLTSSKEESDLVRSYEQGCNSYVRKPVDFREFVEAVSSLGLYWVVVNEPPPTGSHK
jgi:two-component system response regulator